MIKIEPYYRRTDGKSILKLYLRMVADVVPFPPEDVLYDDEEGRKCCVRGRRKTTPDDAERYIKEYSTALHTYLYSSGQLVPERLRSLLTVTMSQGNLPPQYYFPPDDPDGSAKDNLTRYVFHYQEFSRHKHIHQFVQSLGVEVCPYCNRLFTTTVDEDDKKARPQLDHFKNKKDYPYLALSINNLVPSCGVCNLLKRDKDEEFLYPYEDEFGEEYVFRTDIPSQNTTAVLTGAKISPQQFEITIGPCKHGCNQEKKKRIEASLKALALEELYQAHKGYVSRLYFQRYILTDKMLEDIFEQFHALFSSKEDVRFALASIDTQRNHWGDWPLAKLTHDIQEEMEELYATQMTKNGKGK